VCGEKKELIITCTHETKRCSDDDYDDDDDDKGE